MNSFEQLTEGSNKSPIDFDNLLASLATDGPCDWNQDVAHTEPQNFQVDTHQFSDPNPTYATIDIVEALRKDLDELRREYSSTQTACYEHDTKFSIMQENLEAFM